MAPRAVRPLLLALGIVSLGSAVAFADDGPPRVASTAGPVRPEETILRLAAQAKRQLVLFVGGFASDPRDASPFAALAARLREHGVAYFGADGDGEYETSGNFAANGEALRDAVRRKVRRDDYAAVHVVAHSMGGNVSDAAFALGLGWRDNVDSYAAIDAPHRGSAVALTLRRTLDDPFVPRRESRELLGALAERLAGIHISGDEPALADLGRPRRPSAPRRVRTVVVSVPNSEFVNSSESRLDGAERRVLLVAPLRRDGERWRVGAHGLVLEDPLAAEIVAANVDGRRVAPGLGERLAGEGVGFVGDVVRWRIYAQAERTFRQAVWTLFAIKAMTGTTRWPPP